MRQEGNRARERDLAAGVAHCNHRGIAVSGQVELRVWQLERLIHTNLPLHRLTVSADARGHKGLEIERCADVGFVSNVENNVELVETNTQRGELILVEESARRNRVVAGEVIYESVAFNQNALAAVAKATTDSNRNQNTD